jgi:hypothetical protein
MPTAWFIAQFLLQPACIFVLAVAEDTGAVVCLYWWPTNPRLLISSTIISHPHCSLYHSLIHRSTAIYGGAAVAEQIADLKRGTHIVVATPGKHY